MTTPTRTTRPMLTWLLAAAVALCLGAATGAAVAQVDPVTGQPAPGTPGVQGSQPMEGVAITEKLGDDLPLDLTFTDETGKTVTLGDYFVEDRPVILSLVYYQCPGMCKAELSAMVDVFRKMNMTPGDEFQVVNVSFDTRETVNVAAGKKRTLIDSLGKPEAAKGWALLTGDQANVDKLTAATGFQYRWIEDAGQFAHDSALILVTPDGRISRYIRGYHFDPATLELSLVEVSGGKIGTLGQRIQIQLCGYDPRYGKYVLLAQRVMSLGGAATMVLVVAVVAYFWFRERKQSRKALNSDSEVQVHPV